MSETQSPVTGGDGAAQTVSRVAAAIDRAKADGRAALVGYLPAGYPTMETSVEAAIELARNGADIIEIGIPYSDPVMDGSTIQAATAEALANGFHVADVFDVVKAVTEATEAVVLVMTYWNPVMRMGVDEFARRLAEAGGVGLITPDLIPDEAAEWLEASDKYGLDRVFLVAPSTSPARMAMTVAATRGFTYAVSLMGVTGARQTVDESARRVVTGARDAGAECVCVGLGVSNAEHVREIAAYADGVIVGTAIVSALRQGGPTAVGRLAAQLRGGLAPLAG
ncbi:tryptophan synthase subunit alpha [Arthrobacter sp. M4]|uniref:tryptophan synthase subunit alpha n=1 Tax=Arthrobacter sp. M4 TaxID=218160 RepID=UPI001CDC376C|nr:tryptophan synthase subunit alpha [Arthrobacter sp. M4]MCA4132513.1 tryptophan synthase subunit alpha [Arthrobacter sp. M4]